MCPPHTQPAFTASLKDTKEVSQAIFMMIGDMRYKQALIPAFSSVRKDDHENEAVPLGQLKTRKVNLGFE